jgi:hypothetical protein
MKYIPISSQEKLTQKYAYDAVTVRENFWANKLIAEERAKKKKSNFMFDKQKTLFKVYKLYLYHSN